MNPIPARSLRPQAENCPTRPKTTERERARRAYILDAAKRIFIAHGRTRVTLREFAVATGLTQIAIRNQIADLDHLFALILADHLNTILTALGAIHGHGPDLLGRRRAEYLRITRGFLNIPTPLHFLWLRERFTLPEDELDPLEQTQSLIGHLLAAEHWQTALALLDSHHLDAPAIENMLAAHANAAAPEPAVEDEAPQTAQQTAEDTAREPAEPAAPAQRPGHRLILAATTRAMPQWPAKPRDHPNEDDPGGIRRPPKPLRQSLN